jgi:hypothetical protein
MSGISDLPLREMRVHAQRFHVLAVTTPDREEQIFYRSMALEYDFLIDERLIELRAIWRSRDGGDQAPTNKTLVA